MWLHSAPPPPLLLSPSAGGGWRWRRSGAWREAAGRGVARWGARAAGAREGKRIRRGGEGEEGGKGEEKKRREKKGK
jgi:hypothetical protein